MKKNRAERLEEILASYGGEANLGQLLEAVREDGGLAYKLTNAVSELREDLQRRSPPKTIRCHKGATPSQNLYRIEDYYELFDARRAA